MNCADIEVIIGDYAEGTLSSAQRAEIEEHLAQCPACAEMASDCAAAVAFMGSAAEVEPPPELMTRILFEAPWNKGKPKASGWRKWFSGALSPILQPKFVMGMAMTILSLSMLMRFVSPASLSARDWRPSNMMASLEDRVNYAWGRTVKYYDNLKFVYQIQTTLRTWQQRQEEEQRPGAEGDPGELQDGRKLPATSSPGESQSNGATP